MLIISIYPIASALWHILMFGAKPLSDPKPWDESSATLESKYDYLIQDNAF